MPNNYRSISQLLLNLRILKWFEFPSLTALEAFVLNRAATAVELLALVTLIDLRWNEPALLAPQAISHGLEETVVLHFVLIDIVG